MVDLYSSQNAIMSNLVTSCSRCVAGAGSSVAGAGCRVCCTVPLTRLPSSVGTFRHVAETDGFGDGEVHASCDSPESICLAGPPARTPEQRLFSVLPGLSTICGGRIPIPFGTGSAARVVAEREPVTSSGLASVSSLTTVRWGSPDLHGIEVGMEGFTAPSAGADAFGVRVGSIDS